MICGDDPCNGTNSSWFEANSKLSQVQPGFTGKTSLQVMADLRPDKGQVYSVQYCPDAIALADALGASVFVPESAVSESSLPIVILAKPEGIESLAPVLCQELEKHLEGCDNCRVVLNTTKRTIELVHSPAEKSDLPEDVRERLFKRLNLDDYLKPAAP